MSKQNFTRPCLDLNKRTGALEERTLPLRCFITFVSIYYLMVRVKNLQGIQNYDIEITISLLFVNLANIYVNKLCTLL